MNMSRFRRRNKLPMMERMNYALRMDKTSLAAFIGLAILCTASMAQTPTGSGWTGTVGAGPVVFPKYTGGTKLQSLVLPIAYVEYDDWFYVNLFRAGAYFWSSEDKKQGLGFAVEPRIGFNSGDGPRLAGMPTRRSALFGGLAYNAENDLGSMSLGYFTDLGNASHGGYVDLLFNRTLFKNQLWEVSGTFELSRSDSKYANYYFGVTPGEVTPARALYTLGASTNVTLWLTGQYKFGRQYALMFGANVTRLGASAAASPIVERREVPFLYLGFGRNL